MNFARSLGAFALIAVCAGLPAMSQTGRGTLTGSVVDAEGGVLQGAKVMVDPGGATALSDGAGQFAITGIASGEYSVSITYSGFSMYVQKVSITGGQSIRVAATLVVAANKQEIKVYAGRAGGELEAINRTVHADNIINVLPADVITSLPNANVADAIGRLPSVTLERDEGEGKYVQVRGTEPRLTHTTLDGVTIASPETVRQIKLDLIPADLVESVQINKTLQANMEGDGIGGSVDLRTKSASDRTTIALESTGGYTPIIGGRTAYQFDGTVGKRFMTDKKLGVIVSGSYDWNGRGINDLEPGPAVQGTYDLRNYRYFRDRRGFAGTLDYRFTDTSSVYLKGLYSHFNNFGDDWIYSPSTGFDSPGVGDGGGSVKFQALRRRPVQDIGGLQLGGANVVRGAVFNWDIDASVGRTRDAGYSFANFAPIASSNPLNNVGYNLDLNNPLEPHLNVTNGVNIFDPSKYYFENRQVQNYYNPEVDLGFGASLEKPYTLAGHSSTFEFGGRFRNEHKFVNQDTRIYYQNQVTFNAKGRPVYVESPELAMTNFLNDFSDPNYYGGAYKFGPAIEFDKVRAFAGQSDKGVGDVIGNAFNQLEKVSAGYLMNTTNLGNFRLVLGVRIEGTNENNLGSVGSSRATNPGTSKVRVQGSYVDVLPSASLRYALTPTQGLRLVYGRGLSRPNFGDLVPFVSAPSGGSARSTYSQGNPNLKAEYADNIDLLYENSLPHTGLLQVGFFYKNLSNPIVSTTTYHAPDANVTSGPYFLNQTINAGSAYVYGFEIAFQQHFTYLPGLLNGLGVSTNYGYTNSQAQLPPFIDLKATPAPPVGSVSGPNRGPGGSTAPLLRQSPNTFNFSPTYDKSNLSLRLGMVYNQAEIYSYGYNDGSDGKPFDYTDGSGGGLHGPNGDTYLYSHLQVDLQGTYNLPKGFTVVAYGLNLNNEVFGFYNGDPQYPVQREFYKSTFGGGLRWSPKSNR
jgi:TonB-dependent receptor